MQYLRYPPLCMTIEGVMYHAPINILVLDLLYQKALHVIDLQPLQTKCMTHGVDQATALKSKLNKVTIRKNHNQSF